MPRKAYIADLQRLAGNSGVENISNVRAGSDDGEFRFTISLEGANASYEISALIPDVSEYPSGHEYHIFGDDSAPVSVGHTLNRLPRTSALALPDLLQLVARAFLEGSDGDAVMHDSQFDGGVSDEDDGDYDAFSEDEMFGKNKRSSITIDSTSHFASASAGSALLRDRIRSDLSLAKAAGFKVGHQGPLLDGRNSYVSLGIRISKLGISEEAMQAWELQPSDYLILLIQYPGGFQSIDDIQGLDATSVRKAISFKVGVSSRYKPTFQEAVSAFTKLTGDQEEKQRREQLQQAKNDNHQQGFRGAFISRPLNELLNERLATILKYRLIGMSWQGSEEFYNDYQGKAFMMTGSDYMDKKYMNMEPQHSAFPAIVTADHLLDAKPGQRISLPLLGMQFLLRHFVRCTEFCLVCHCKLEDNLEALKPYVCDKPLCLYQYMSLGFGPSIEHEIISQPYVVDLLVSFCYHAAAGGKLGAFPDGLSLNVPPSSLYPIPATVVGGYYAGRNPQPTPVVTPRGDQAEGYKARINRDTLELLFDKGNSLQIRVGDWLCFSPPGHPDQLEHCRVTEVHLFPVCRVSLPVSKPFNELNATDQTTKKAAPKSANSITTVFTDITFYKYDMNFDNLDEQQKRGAVLQQLDLLPPVKEIKEYLLSSRLATLSSWTDRISPTASGILRWIIASNRACIVAVDSPEQPDYGQGERVRGMENWMQFKFAMGAPDKERRFINAMQVTQTRLNLTYPTLFAWHGSPMQNWHGIIREGLHFRDTLHGRAYGNGVYHSLDFNTSYGYSGRHYDYGTTSRFQIGSWPCSALNMGCAMALNEVVNAPAEFVSRSPHLVVQHLDWIQTRYLFVQCGNADLKFGDGDQASVPFPQDSTMTPNGQKGKIIIPVRAMPKSRRAGTDKERTRKKMRQAGSVTDPVAIDIDNSDSASIDTEIEDINIFIENEEDYVPAVIRESVDSSQPLVKKSRGKLSGLINGLKSKASSKDKASSGGASTSMTDFQPGTLDIGTLPIMAEPSFATTSASRRLQKDFQALLKVQSSTPLHELGWYTNEEHFTNMYQWIVELHSFDPTLPLAKQMKQKGMKSVVVEMRFGPDYPMSPPFIRVIKPRFLGFMHGGGGHVTAGGSICMELLTNSGWSAVSSIESVLLQVRLAISSTDPRPAQLDMNGRGSSDSEYSIGESVDAYLRACAIHGWKPPDNFKQMAYGGQENTGSRY